MPVPARRAADHPHGPPGATDHHDWVLAMLGSEPEPALDRIAALAGRLVSSRVALVSIVDDGRQAFVGEAGLADAGHPGVRSTPLSQSLCQMVKHTKAPLVLDDAAADPRVGEDHGAVRELGFRAYAGVPVQAEGETVGALCALEQEPREWTEHEVQTLADLATIASALLEARIAERRAAESAARERESSQLLQRTLMPDTLPALPGLDVAAWYRAAETLVGGDWYELLPLGDGQVAFVLGDVVGHGLQSAAASTQLRAAFHAQLVVDASPAAVLARLEEVARAQRTVAYSSVVVGRIDPASGDVEWISAGHPPVVLNRGGRAQLDAAADYPVLAVTDPGAIVSVRTARLAPGDGIVLYSDGLVDDREDLVERPERLREACEAGWPGGAQAVVEAAMAGLRPKAGVDDVAVLVIRRAP